MKCHKCNQPLYYSGGCLGEWKHLNGTRQCSNTHYQACDSRELYFAGIERMLSNANDACSFMAGYIMKLERKLAVAVENLQDLKADMRLAIDSYLVSSLLPGVDEKKLEEIKQDLKHIIETYEARAGDE